MAVEPEKIEQVLALIEQGESENAACKQVGIARNTFRSAALKYGAADKYARATEALARDQVEKLETTIEELRQGKINVDVAKVEIDARKWIASKLFKPTWGDKQAVEVSGGMTIASIDPRELTDEQLQVLSTLPPRKPE